MAWCLSTDGPLLRLVFPLVVLGSVARSAFARAGNIVVPISVDGELLEIEFPYDANIPEVGQQFCSSFQFDDNSCLELQQMLANEQAKAMGDFDRVKCEEQHSGQARLRCEHHKQLLLEDEWVSSLSSPNLKGFLEFSEAAPDLWFGEAVLGPRHGRTPFDGEQQHGKDVLAQSTLETHIANTKPKEQIWSSCTMCSYKNSQVALYDPDRVLSKVHGNAPRLAQSRYHGYFLPRSDRIEGTIQNQLLNMSDCTHIVKPPTFIIQILNLHFGHVLIDLLEPLYHTMMSEYGQIVRDSIIFIESGSHEDQAMVSTLIDDFFHPSRDMPQGMLRFLTANAIHSKAALDLLSSSSNVCFERLHVGLEADLSHLHLGYARHPRYLDSYPLRFNNFANTMVMNDFRQQLNAIDVCEFERGSKLSDAIRWEWEAFVQPSGWSKVALEYARFKCFLMRNIEQGWSPSLTSSLKYAVPVEKNDVQVVTLIKRKGKRRIQNADELLQHSKASLQEGTVVQEVDLEEVGFSEQIRFFRNSTVLLGSYGTGMHNVIFMKPKSSVILVMQPGWCEWQWRFTNQAILSRQRVFTYCSSGEHCKTASRTFRWCDGGWTRGPVETRDADMHVDLPKMELLLEKATTDVGDGTGQVTHHEMVQYGEDDWTCPTIGKYEEAIPFVRAGISEIVYRHNELSLKLYAVMGGAGADPLAFARSSPASKMCLALNATYISCVGFQIPKDIRIGNVFAGIHLLTVWLTNQDGTGVLEGSQSSLSYRAAASADVKTVGPLEYNTERDKCLFRNALQPFLENYKRLAGDQSLALANLVKCIGPWCWVKCNGACSDLSQWPDIPGFFHMHFTILPLVFEDGNVLYILIPEASVSSEEVATLIDQNCKAKYGAVSHALLSRCHTFLAAQSDIAEISVADNYSLDCPNGSELSVYPLPRIQVAPTFENPFVFIHIEKTAGSTLRHHLFETAMARNYSCLIPGKTRCADDGVADNKAATKVPHMTFNLFDDITHQRRTQILAGHFEWGVWDQMSQPPHRVSCFVILREPVARVVSLYYERLFPVTGLPLSSFSEQELENYMVSFVGGGKDGRQLRDEGFSNGAVKALSTANVHKGRIYDVETPMYRPMSLPVAKKRMEQCVVGIQEHWSDTTLVLRHWFPWVEVTYQDWNVWALE